MNRWVVAAVAAALVVGAAGGVVASSLTRSLTVKYSDIKLSVNGKAVDTGTSEPFVVVDEGRTYVPARYLAEALGARVSWDANSSTVVAVTPDYMTTSTSDGALSIGVPYYGVSIHLPSGSSLLPRQSGALFMANSPAGVIGLFRQPTDAAYSVAMFWKQYESGLSAYAFGAPKPVTVNGATEAWEGVGTGKSSAGVAMTITARYVVGPKNTWLLQVVSRSDGYSQQSADQVFDTFQFGE